MSRKPSKSENKIAANQAPPSEIPSPIEAQPPVEREPRNMQEYLGIAAEVAQDTIYVRNSRWDGALEDFPHEPLLRTVEKYFPHAEGGPLYIDGPISVKDKRAVADCQRKAEKMRARSLRYVYIARDAQDNDPSVDEVLAQLEDERGVA